MRFEPIEHLLHDSTKVIIRSLRADDAVAAKSYLKLMYESTPFLTRYPEEWSITDEEEQKYLQSYEQSPTAVVLGAFTADDRIIGMASIAAVGTGLKMRHRVRCGLSVCASYEHKGLGTLLMQLLIGCAKQAGFEQLELEVAHTNLSAIHIYEKLSFRTVGAIPHGFKNKDGSYYDLIIMVRNL